MPTPQFKVTVTHSGTSTDYTPDPFIAVNVKKRENNYDTASLTFTDEHSSFYEDSFDHFDEVKIYFKDLSESAYTQVFGGHVRQVIPQLNGQAISAELVCKGYAQALEETHCKRDYGLESANPTLNTAKEIWDDVLDNFVNLSLGSANSTGWSILSANGANDTIADIASGTSIKYVNNPYRTCLEVVDTVCDLTSAIGAGSTAGAHWVVDNSKRLIVNTIGSHEDTTEWPDWWNTDQTGSTLTQGADFGDYALHDKAEEFSNNVIVVTDFRRPSYDYWTDGANCETLWGYEAASGVPPWTVTLSDEATIKTVGTHSLEAAMSQIGTRHFYYPAAANAGWDVTKWGSERKPPFVNLATYRDSGVHISDFCLITAYSPLAGFDWNGSTVAGAGWLTGDDAATTWTYHRIPIGPYHANVIEKCVPMWDTFGGATVADWNNINGIYIQLTSTANPLSVYIDDVHFSGQIARSAKNSYSILGNGAAPVVAAKNEYQKVLIARNSMDDSCKATDDTGFAGRMAYAELLRRQKRPKTIQFTVFGKPDMKAAMAGQKLHVHACTKLDGTYRVDATFRILEIEHHLDSKVYSHTITATTDLYNSNPISTLDKFASMQENLFLNSKEAKNIRAGAEIDLLIPIMQKDYPTDDD